MAAAAAVAPIILPMDAMVDAAAVLGLPATAELVLLTKDIVAAQQANLECLARVVVVALEALVATVRLPFLATEALV
jgi:hypothetical protein